MEQQVLPALTICSIRNDADAVLSILNNIRNEFTEVFPIPVDKEVCTIMSLSISLCVRLYGQRI